MQIKRAGVELGFMCRLRLACRLRRSLAVAAVTSVGWVNNLGVSQGLLTGVQVIESSDYQVKFVSKERSHHHHHDGGEGEGEDNVDCQLSDVLVGSLKC